MAETAPRYVIGVDGGTEALRAGVFDVHGVPLAYAATPYATQYPHPGHAEQAPADWWAALGASVRAAVAQAGVPGESIAGMCLDTVRLHLVFTLQRLSLRQSVCRKVVSRCRDRCRDRCRELLLC